MKVPLSVSKINNCEAMLPIMDNNWCTELSLPTLRRLAVTYSQMWRLNALAYFYNKNKKTVLIAQIPFALYIYT